MKIEWILVNVNIMNKSFQECAQILNLMITFKVLWIVKCIFLDYSVMAQKTYNEGSYEFLKQ
jgi:hypothetical protein